MVKQRMSTADVAGEVACLRHSVLGMRVANVYDVNSKVFLCHSRKFLLLQTLDDEKKQADQHCLHLYRHISLNCQRAGRMARKQCWC